MTSARTRNAVGLVVPNASKKRRFSKRIALQSKHVFRVEAVMKVVFQSSEEYARKYVNAIKFLEKKSEEIIGKYEWKTVVSHLQQPSNPQTWAVKVEMKMEKENEKFKHFAGTKKELDTYKITLSKWAKAVHEETDLHVKIIYEFPATKIDSIGN